MTVRATAPAKVNLGLRVLGRDPNGLHQIRSLIQSIDLADTLTADRADEDGLRVRGAQVPAGAENLIWKAMNAYREESGQEARFQIDLEKQIPTSAGLGGGSADAAAALRIAETLMQNAVKLDTIAPHVGADVPFCLVGGLAIVEGYGERVSSIDASPPDYCLGLVVPPIELATAGVYSAWDRLDGPTTEGLSDDVLPPSLRGLAPLGNDLYPAARSVYPALEDWRAELAEVWDRPVSMTGSGPTLFAYFAGRDEAEDALRATPSGARATQAASPIPDGARVVDR